MESTATNGNSSGSNSGGFWSGLGSIFLDTLDQASDAAIEKEFGENAAEQNEGPGEFANPGTVSQPVYHSQLPSGQPLNIQRLAMTLGVSVPVLLMIAGSLLYFFFWRKG